MKAKSLVLYLSIALNVALLVLAVRPATEYKIAYGQVAQNAGAYSAVSSQAGGSQHALWIADRVSGNLAVFQYELGVDESPFQVMDRRDLREDLQERTIGNIMMISANTSSSNSVVCVIDTDSERMAVYRYDRPNRRIEAVQRSDLRIDLGMVPADDDAR